MIPELGLMVGLYIMTRMLQVLFPKRDQRQNIFVLILAGVTVVVTVFVIADLFIRGAGGTLSGY